MRSAKLFLRGLSPIWLLLCCLLPSLASAQALPWPHTAILFQPLFVWRTGPPSRQGTGFLAKAPDGLVAAVTSAHLVDPQGPVLLEARWLDVRTRTTVAVFTRSWGAIGRGRH